MVNKCSAVNCKSGYRGQPKEPNLSFFFTFPLEDQDLLKERLSGVKRKDFMPTKNSTLCSKHFKQEDFIEYSVDQQLRRQRRRVDQTLTRKRLKPEAVPSVFENFSDFYWCKDVTSRSGLALASSRHDKEASLLYQQNEEFLLADRLTSFDDLNGALSNELQSKTFIMHKTNNGSNLINLTE